MSEVFTSQELDWLRSIVDRIGYKPGYKLLLEEDKMVNGGRVYLQVEAFRLDTVTGEMGEGRSGKAYLSPFMTLSEIVRRAFGLFLGYEEHECREFFTFDGRRVFGPHINVLALYEIANEVDVRKSKEAAGH